MAKRPPAPSPKKTVRLILVPSGFLNDQPERAVQRFQPVPGYGSCRVREQVGLQELHHSRAQLRRILLWMVVRCAASGEGRCVVARIFRTNQGLADLVLVLS